MLEDTAPYTGAAPSGGTAAPGTLVGRFVILGKLGEGATSEVYEAHDPTLDRSVALKLLRESTAHAARLEREARALAKLSHPNVVSVYEVGVYEGRVFLALELVRGDTLTVWAQGKPVEAIIDAFLQAGRGLAAAHRAGLVHRDFKPDNVIVGDEGRVRVADFGLARRPRRHASEPSAASSSGAFDVDATVTLEATVVGTPAFAAPEAHDPTQRFEATADVYSFCCSLYAVLAGVRPFTQNSADALLAAKLEGVSSRAVPSGVPSWLWQVVLQGLRAEPVRRQPDLDAVVAQIVSGRRRRRMLWSIAAFVVLAGSVAAGWWVSRAASRRACAQVPEALAPVWTRDAQRQVRRAFESHGDAGEARWDRVHAGLLAYERSIAEQWGRVCVRHRVEETLPASLFERSAECLRDRHDALAAVTDVLSGADEALVERSEDSVASLPLVEDCGRDELLPLLGRSMGSGDARPLRAKLRKIVQRMGSSGSSEAMVELGELVAEAEALGDEGLLAEIELEASRLSEGSVSTEAALKHARRATVLARTAGIPLVEAQAWTQLAWLQRTFFGDFERAWNSTEHAEAALQTVGRHRPTLALLELERAALEASTGDCAGATRRSEAVLELLEGHPHDGVLALTHHTLAICACRSGRSDEGLTSIDTALQTHRRRGTIVSQNVGALLQTRAQCLWGGGHEAESLLAYAEAEAALAEVVPPEHRHRVVVQLNWALVLAELGRYRESVEHATLAVQRADAGLGPGELMRATTRFVRANGHRALEEWGIAATLLREGLEFLEAYHPEHFDQSAIHRNLLADTLASAGRTAEAREVYARVVEMTHDRSDLASVCQEARQGWARLGEEGSSRALPGCAQG